MNPISHSSSTTSVANSFSETETGTTYTRDTSVSASSMEMPTCPRGVVQNHANSLVSAATPGALQHNSGAAQYFNILHTQNPPGNYPPSKRPFTNTVALPLSTPESASALRQIREAGIPFHQAVSDRNIDGLMKKLKSNGTDILFTTRLDRARAARKAGVFAVEVDGAPMPERHSQGPHVIGIDNDGVFSDDEMGHEGGNAPAGSEIHSVAVENQYERRDTPCAPGPARDYVTKAARLCESSNIQVEIHTSRCGKSIDRVYTTLEQLHLDVPVVAGADISKSFQLANNRTLLFLDDSRKNIAEVGPSAFAGRVLSDDGS